jgi:hypothetical protein
MLTTEFFGHQMQRIPADRISHIRYILLASPKLTILCYGNIQIALCHGNYLKIIGRNFLQNKWFAILNLLGPAIGFSVFILSSLYVYFETHFEDFHQNAGRIYRATYRYTPSEAMRRRRREVSS